MTKFAMINTTRALDKKQLNAFNNKFTATRIKKLLKCKEVIDFNELNYNAETLKSVTEINEDKFDNIVNELSDFNISSLTSNSNYKISNQRYFAFSNDAINTSFSFEIMTDDLKITFFEVNDDEVDSFIKNIEIIKSNNESIENLNEAKEVLESLQNYENDLNISLTRYGADDEIDNKTQELEEEVEEASDQIRDLCSWAS